MKAKLLAFVSLASLFFLNGCNGIGGKDTLLARIDDEKVYQEDYTMYLMMNGELKQEKNYFLYDHFYSKAALVSRALSEYPELKAEWDAYYRELDPRILTMVFQRFYAMERLTYSDAELRHFYDANRDLFAADSTGDFVKVRRDVAGLYYASKNPEKFIEFLNSRGVKPDSTGAIDTLSWKRRFGDVRRSELRDELSQGVLEKAGFSVQSLPAVDPKEYFNKHKDEFMTVPGYEVFHIQGKDSASLMKVLPENATLDQFKAAAVKYSTNKKTAKDSGYVGRVKKDFALPYEIGMVPALSKELEGKEPGFVTLPLRSEKGEAYHRFYLQSYVPSVEKSYERAGAGIASLIKAGEIFEIDTSAVLIMKNGEPVFTEADLMRFNEQFVRRKLTMTTHERIVSMLAENFAFAELAKQAKLNHTWEYRALVRETRMDFIIEKYLDKKLLRNDIPEDSLKALYDKVGSPIHEGYSYEKAKEDLRKVLSFPMNLYKQQYFMGYRLLYKDKTFEQAIPVIYYQRQQEYRKLYGDRLAAEAYSKAVVHLYDMSVPEYKPDMLVDVLIPKADSLYKAGKKSPAFYAYRKVMYAYAENDSLFEHVAYEMAQIENENSEFEDADGDYYAFYMMWPNSVNAEKAMFSRGFILNENMGANEKALEVLEGFVQKYPNSELKESAQWLVDNIKSNGKLAEDLMKKIEAEE